MVPSTFLRLTAGLALMLMLSACGDGSDSKPQNQTPAEKVAALDQGPRASEVMHLDENLALRGATLFEEKICSDCHTLGEEDIGPDLLGVMDRRTKPWLVMQITEPEWMALHDPVTQKLVADYGMEMADLGVPEADVEPILHFLLREGLVPAENVTE